MSEIKFSCPECGTEFSLSISAKINKSEMKAAERIEALRKAGVDVSNLFAIQGANGGDYVACNQDGVLKIMDNDDPLFKHIMEGGAIPNRKLFRRWVMAQTFRIINYADSMYGPNTITGVIAGFGYEYQWKMLVNELYAQCKMFQNGDYTSFEERNRWFNHDMVVKMMEQCCDDTIKYFDSLQTRSYKGQGYKRFNGNNVLVHEFVSNRVGKMYNLVNKTKQCSNTPFDLYKNVMNFVNYRKKAGLLLRGEKQQCTVWLNAYKGAGAFFTLQNMICFHNCFLMDDAGRKLDKECSLLFLKNKAILYSNEGWRLFGVLRKALNDNNINISEKIQSWREK